MNESEINDVATMARDLAGEWMRDAVHAKFRGDAFAVAVQAAGCTMLSALVASTHRDGEEPTRAMQLLEACAAEINRELAQLGYEDARLRVEA